MKTVQGQHFEADISGGSGQDHGSTIMDMAHHGHGPSWTWTTMSNAIIGSVNTRQIPAGK
jgi:hypothetical protein